MALERTAQGAFEIRTFAIDFDSLPSLRTRGLVEYPKRYVKSSLDYFCVMADKYTGGQRDSESVLDTFNVRLEKTYSLNSINYVRNRCAITSNSLA